ncbi:MAG: Crp/Fnr family transcriptional regulator [Dongiaceae bacterium]
MVNGSASARVPGACDQCPVRTLALYWAIGEGPPAATAEAISGLKRGHRLLPARRTIYREGETSDEMFTLFDGWAFRFKVLPDGRWQILSFLLPGDTISLHLLRFDRLHFSVQSLTAVSLCIFDRASLADYVRARPALERRVETFCARETAAADERLADLGRRSAQERAARLVLHLLARLRQGSAVQGQSFEFPLRQQHIADALGLTSVHVSRVFHALRADGLVAVERNRLTILDPRALMKTAGIRQSDLDAETLYSPTAS